MDASLRLFFGLPVPEEWRPGLVRWQAEAFGGASVRQTAPEHLHVTLAFLGWRPEAEVVQLEAALRDAAAGQTRPVLTATRYRETERVGMLVFADEGERAARFQARLSAQLEALGVYEPERRPWLPHVTVARFTNRPRLRLQPPPLGQMTPTEAALYRSRLGRGGAVYDVLAAVALARNGDECGTEP